MREFWAQAAAELEALGARCVIHGPEFWLVLGRIALLGGVFLLGVIVGMFVAALLGANGRDDDERH